MTQNYNFLLYEKVWKVYKNLNVKKLRFKNQILI